MLTPKTNPGELLAVLETKIDPELLTLALTHRSYAYEYKTNGHNERLEFLGDAILGQTVTVMLYRDYPETSEGGLAKRRANLVSAVALAEVARNISLGDYLLLGRGEELTGGRDKQSILADTLEALIGATYLSAGQDSASELVLRLIAPLLADTERFGIEADAKTTLQEMAVELGHPIPEYLISDFGPSHAKHFVAKICFGDKVLAEGEGSSKKQAELSAARKALAILREQKN